MPRYYCDYCDTYLTHDSPSVRKQHNAGYKHKANVRAYYQQFEEQQTQSLIDQRVREHLGQTFQQQVGAAFQQHLAAIQSGQRPRLPLMPPPTLPVPGAASVPNGIPPMRPPILPRPPMAGAPGYTMPTGSAPMMRPPGAVVTAPPGVTQSNGLPVPPTLNPPVSAVTRPPNSIPASASNGLAVSSAPSSNSVPPTSAPYGTYNYPAPPPSYSQPSSS